MFLNINIFSYSKLILQLLHEGKSQTTETKLSYTEMSESWQSPQSQVQGTISKAKSPVPNLALPLSKSDGSFWH